MITRGRDEKRSLLNKRVSIVASPIDLSHFVPSFAPDEAQMKYVLYIDEERDFSNVIKNVIESQNPDIEITLIESVNDLGDIYLDEIDCIVIDYKKEGIKETTFLNVVRRSHKIPILLYSSGRAGQGRAAAEAEFKFQFDGHVSKSGQDSVKKLVTQIRYLVRSIRLTKSLDLIMETSDNINKVSPKITESIDVISLKEKMSEFEDSLRNILEQQKSYNNLLELRDDITKLNQKMNELPTSDPESQELLEKFSKLESILNLPDASLNTPLFAARIKEQMDSLEERLTLQIKSSSQIINVYEKVINQQSDILKWVKWGIVLAPIATITLAFLEFLRFSISNG